MKTFCCRFKLKDGYFTLVWIEAEEMTEKIATKWANKQVVENEKYVSVDAVYEAATTRK